MEDTKKSVIRYEHMLVTPDLLEYLGFEDVSTKLLRTMPERSMFLRDGIVVVFAMTNTDSIAMLKCFYSLLHAEGLTLKIFIDEILERKYSGSKLSYTYL